MREAIDRVYRGKLRAGDIDADLVRTNALKTFEGVLQGFRKAPSDYAFGSPEQRLLIQMRYNVHVTSVFKNHHNTLEMVGALFDEQGNRKSREQFVRDARKINERYYESWLRTEYNTAEAMGNWGSEWAEFKRRGGSLKYMTQGDGRVREEHEILHGAVYPVEHAFWRRYYPPNGYNCRCFVRWAGRDATTQAPKGLPELKPIFDGNVGETGMVFTEDHPYFTVDGRFRQRADRLFGYRPPLDPDRFLNNLETFEILKGDPNHRLAFTDNLSGGYVFRHILHPEHEYRDHIAPARLMAARDGDGIILRQITQGSKNPDAMINGELWDFKKILATSNVVNAMNNKFRAARRQDLSQVIVTLGNDFPIAQVIEGVRTAFSNDRRTQIQNLKLIIAGQLIIDVTRKDYENGVYRDLIEKEMRTLD